MFLNLAIRAEGKKQNLRDTFWWLDIDCGLKGAWFDPMCYKLHGKKVGVVGGGAEKNNFGAFWGRSRRNGQHAAHGK